MTNATRLLLALTATNMVMVSATALMTGQTARAQESNAQQVQPNDSDTRTSDRGR